MSKPTTTAGGGAAAGAAARPDAEPRAIDELRGRIKDPGFWAEWTVIPAFIVLIVVFGLISDVFLTGDNIESVLAASAVLIVLAIGQTFAVATAGIDLSMGSVLTLSGVVLGQLYSDGRSIWLAMLVALLVGVGAHVLLFQTRFGTHLLATGGNSEGSRAVGVRTQRMKIAAYTISGAMAGLAAILLVARIGSAEPAAATSLLLNAVAAVVLGGVSLFGGRGTIDR